LKSFFAQHMLAENTRYSAAEKALIETGPGNRLTWLGHSAILLCLGGWDILYEPFLSDYATSIPSC
jgi:hypothetical protein